MDRPTGAPSPALLIAGNLAVDAVTAEVVEALRAEGVRSILLKGPAIAVWLYADEVEAPRAYDDLDLLIRPDDADRCERVLEQLGFGNRVAAFAPGEWVEHSSEWMRRGSPVVVDLHRGLLGAKAEPARIWKLLADGTERLTVGGHEVEVPSLPARALIIALHAAQHGAGHPRPLRDLSRALERGDDPLWDQVTALADGLEATPALAAGLLMLPEGAAVAARLGIADAVDAEAAVLAQSPVPTAYGFARLAAIPGPRAKLAFLVRKLLPTPAFMRHAFPIARRGRLGLLLAYLWRPVWLLLHAGPGLIAWLRARRRSRPVGGDRA